MGYFQLLAVNTLVVGEVTSLVVALPDIHSRHVFACTASPLISQFLFLQSEFLLLAGDFQHIPKYESPFPENPNDSWIISGLIVDHHKDWWVKCVTNNFRGFG